MSHIHLALQTINSREMEPTDNIVLTIGQMHGGQTSNVIPGEAFMSGTIRTLKNETREMVKTRMCAIVSGIAASFNAEAHVEFGSGCPVLYSNTDIYAQVKEILKTLEGVNVVDCDDIGKDMSSMGSEDFAYIANIVPSTFLLVAADEPENGCCYPQHHPKAKFSEDALPVGAATYAHVAMEWLKNNK
jgi:hippurate hydrolase